MHTLPLCKIHHTYIYIQCTLTGRGVWKRSLTISTPDNNHHTKHMECCRGCWYTGNAHSPRRSRSRDAATTAARQSHPNPPVNYAIYLPLDSRCNSGVNSQHLKGSGRGRSLARSLTALGQMVCMRSEVSAVSPHWLPAPPMMNLHDSGGMSAHGSKSYL